MSRVAPRRYDVASYDQAEPLERVLGERVRVLGHLLVQIEEQAAQRGKLSERLVASIWEEYLSLRCELLPLLEYPFSWDRGWDRRRESLEERLERLASEARHEEVARWRDIAQLWREHREWLQQYRGLVGRLRLLGIDPGEYAKRKQ